MDYSCKIIRKTYIDIHQNFSDFLKKNTYLATFQLGRNMSIAM